MKKIYIGLIYKPNQMNVDFKTDFNVQIIDYGDHVLIGYSEYFQHKLLLKRVRTETVFRATLKGFFKYYELEELCEEDISLNSRRSL